MASVPETVLDAEQVQSDAIENYKQVDDGQDVRDGPSSTSSTTDGDSDVERGPQMRQRQGSLMIDGQMVLLRSKRPRSSSGSNGSADAEESSDSDSVLSRSASTNSVYDQLPAPRPVDMATLGEAMSKTLPRNIGSLCRNVDSVSEGYASPSQIVRPNSLLPRVHIIRATLPPRRERFDVLSRATSIVHTPSKIVPGPHHIRRDRPSSSSDAVDKFSERLTSGWRTLRKRVLRVLGLTNSARRRAYSSPKPHLTDGLHLPAVPKPPLLPRQNSSPLGSLPAPPRPRTHKPLKSPSTASSSCSTSTGIPSSPSTPSLHRATPAPSVSEKNYDSLSLSLLVNRPLPPVPAAENVYADVNFEPNVQEKPPHGLSVYPWFHDVEREDVDRILKNVGEQGCFLVRISRRGGPTNPFTLSILHEGRIFHLNIRKRPDGTFALGSAKPREKTFETVSELIDYHRQEEILLTSRNQPAGSTRLTETYQSDSRNDVEKTAGGW